MTKLTEEEIKEQRRLNSRSLSAAFRCLSEDYGQDLESLIEDLADSLDPEPGNTLKNALDPDYALVSTYDHDYDLDVIHELVDYLQNEAGQEIDAILEDIEGGEGYAKNWLTGLQMTINNKSERIKKALNNLKVEH